MAKNTFLDFDTTESNNTDIAGIGILGTNAVQNFDNAFRTIMAILRRDLDNKVVLATKTGNYTALAADNNAMHRYTAAATVTLTAAATLGANWHYTVVADGADVTIDPDGSETINGKTTLVLPNGSYALIIGSGTAFFALISPLVRQENYVINGNFDVWQDGGGAFTATGYTADMWYLANGTGASNSISRSASNPANYPESSRYNLNWSRSVAGSSASQLIHKMEGVQRTANKTVTVSFTAASSASTELEIYIAQVFGTGGSPSATANTAAQTFNIISTPTKFSAVFTVPSTSGKTLGTNGDDSTWLLIRRLHTATNPTTLVVLSDVSIVDGDARSSPFPARVPSVQKTLADCQRFYEKSDSVGGDVSLFSGTVTNGQTYYALVRFKVTKWKAPSSIALVSLVDLGFPTTTVANGISAGGFTEQRVSDATVTGGVFTSTWVADVRL